MNDIFKGEVPRRIVIDPDMSQEDIAEYLQHDDLTDEQVIELYRLSDIDNQHTLRTKYPKVYLKILQQSTDEIMSIFTGSLGFLTNALLGRTNVEETTKKDNDIFKGEVRKNKSLRQIFEEWGAEKLHDDSSFYYRERCRNSDKKWQKKSLNAENSYAQGEYQSFIILIDITVFGSASDGFYITNDFFYAKPFLEDSYKERIDRISSIYIDTDEQLICINGQNLKYTNSELNSKMSIVVKLIKQYIDQFR